MKKQALKKLPTLTATKRMMQIANDDKPQCEKYYGTNRTKYNYGSYLRCKLHDNILKVSFFLTEHMRMGSKNPVYELFIDHKNRQFITYDRLHDKWLTSKLHLLSWPDYVWGSERWLGKADDSVIKKYFGSDNGGYDDLYQFQLNVRAEELKKRHKKETDPWDLDLLQIPKLPKDWERWFSKVGIQENYIFYRYCKKGADTGYCTYCEKDVPIKQPRHNKPGRCPCCRRTITFKSIGKAHVVITEQVHTHLIQRCKDGFVIREFQGRRKHFRDNPTMPECSSWEIRRSIHDRNGKCQRAYFWGDYKNAEFRWIVTQPCNPHWWGNTGGKIYGKTLPNLTKSELSRTGLSAAYYCLGSIDPEKYLAVLNEVPQLEQLAKAKLPQLVAECMSSYYSFQDKVFNPKANDLIKMLGIDSQGLKRLRQSHGGLEFLEWLRYEKATGKIIPDNVIVWFCNEEISAERIQFILDRMSAVQVFNYLRRQMSIYRKESKHIIGTWADYLSMAKRLKMDTNDEIVFRVNKLYQRHDELVERCHEKELAIQAGEILEKYPHIEDIYQALKEKYSYADANYTIVIPSCIEEILLEGRALHHCVADSERYWERIERQETYVLFLRRTSDVENSYYTLEVEPNGTVRQKRTMYDRQEADIEDATKFLIEWQKEISTRLTAEDRKLGEDSSILRVLQYEQLRTDQVIINTGALRGQLLVDVLLADLMENAAEMPIAA